MKHDENEILFARPDKRWHQWINIVQPFPVFLAPSQERYMNMLKYLSTDMASRFSTEVVDVVHGLPLSLSPGYITKTHADFWPAMSTIHVLVIFVEILFKIVSAINRTSSMTQIRKKNV